ncbi:MAG: low-specificity L-threonine aldolase [Caldiserica bacterium]|nr:low-specificity L-threonine aldolase [Caldisericota bacterium]
MIDLRSDTVTKPTQAMRDAMATAEVGDDVYREDPTVVRLEDLGAGMLGKEAGLFVVSGTMGNQVAIMTHTQRGDELITEAESHIFYYEVGDIAMLSGVQARQVPGKRGVMDPDDVKHAIRDSSNIHFPRTSLIAIENTHNRGGGKVWPIEYVREIAATAHERGIAVHMDGARIFNASIASGIAPDVWASYADSVMFCLSKGLCAPVGSLLVGSREYIERARKNRKRLGGGLRQVGILAAAGIVALETMVERLAEDHANAKLLARELAGLGYGTDPSEAETNMAMVNVGASGQDALSFVAAVKEKGVLCNAVTPSTVRIVTHHDVTTDQCRETVEIFRSLLPA